jgi:anti-sigma factor RsiW
VSCQERSDTQLWEYLDNELPSAARRELEGHLAACSTCQMMVEEMRRRPLAFGQQQMATPPSGFHHRVMARLITEPRPQPAAAWWLVPLLDPGRLMAASAAALTLALLSGAVVGAVLATPAVEAAVPVASAPTANSMLLAMRQALLPLSPFFQEWAWFVLSLGMLATIIVPSVRALAARYLDHL